jgi:putative transport protein
MHWLKNLLEGTPEIALFACLAIGFAVGKVRVKKLSLGGIAGTLIVAIFIGMIGTISVDDQVKQIAFALFIFTLGYISGPSFFASLNRRSLKYFTFTGIEVVSVLAVTAVATLILNLDVGTASGLMAGGATESAVVGTASDAIAKLNLPADQIKTLQGNVGTAYSISYICGLIVIVLLTSQIAPAIMKIDLKAEATKLWKKLGNSTIDPHAVAALPELVGRVQQVSRAAGQRVAQLEAAMGGQATVERIRRAGTSVDFGPDTTVQEGDVLVLVGPRSDLVHAGEVVGPELPASDGLNMELEKADVFVTSKQYLPATIEELQHQIPRQTRHGVFLTGVSRMDNALPMQPGTEVHVGDTVTLSGAAKDVDAFSSRVGFKLTSAVKADFVWIGLGVVVGFLIGKITIRVGSIPLTLATGGGCLLAGLLFGYIRAKRPTFGQYDPAAASVIKDMGLAVFIACVGLSSGPQAVHLVEKYGASLPIAGICMTLIPATISLFVAFKLMKLPAPLGLGSVAGQQCSTPAITAIQQAAGNTTPLISYTIVYALSNIALPLMGPVVVAMVNGIHLTPPPGRPGPGTGQSWTRAFALW